MINLFALWFLALAGCAGSQAQLPAPSVNSDADTQITAQSDAVVQTQEPAAPNTQSQPETPDEPQQDDGAEQEAEPEEFDPDIIPVDDPELDALLDKLEATGDELRNFAANITYRKKDGLLNRKETRIGSIVYVSEPVEGLPGQQIRKFAILFDVLVVNAQRRDRSKHYVFDGRWLAEIDAQSKQFQAREIVPPGRVLDPLKLGEGPFPLPLGQNKREVLTRFIVDWADMPPGGMLVNLENVIGILLVPRPGTDEAREFTRVEVFYDKDSLMPIGVDAVYRNGDRKSVLLKELQHNVELDDDALAKVNIKQPPRDKWVVIIEPWQGD